jgi:hypothetical protein
MREECGCVLYVGLLCDFGISINDINAHSHIVHIEINRLYSAWLTKRVALSRY